MGGHNQCSPRPYFHSLRRQRRRLLPGSIMGEFDYPVLREASQDVWKEAFCSLWFWGHKGSGHLTSKVRPWVAQCQRWCLRYRNPVVFSEIFCLLPSLSIELMIAWHENTHWISVQLHWCLLYMLCLCDQINFNYLQRRHHSSLNEYGKIWTLTRIEMNEECEIKK